MCHKLEAEAGTVAHRGSVSQIVIHIKNNPVPCWNHKVLFGECWKNNFSNICTYLTSTIYNYNDMLWESSR